MTSTNESIKLDLNNPSDALKLISSVLNKAAKSGVYSIDESYAIKLSLGTIEKHLPVIQQTELSLQTPPSVTL
jgi:hypothetical protein